MTDDDPVREDDWRHTHWVSVALSSATFAGVLGLLQLGSLDNIGKTAALLFGASTPLAAWAAILTQADSHAVVTKSRRGFDWAELFLLLATPLTVVGVGCVFWHLFPPAGIGFAVAVLCATWVGIRL